MTTSSPPQPSSRIARIVQAILLVLIWVWTHESMSRPARTEFRDDRLEAVAYPAVDAFVDYADAVSFIRGDGLVNNREYSRWTTYKPGQSILLGVIGWWYDFEPEPMQRTLTWFYALAGPLIFLATRRLYPGTFRDPVALALTGLVIVVPSEPKWWFAKTMLTEGPMLVLCAAICWLALRMTRARRWPMEDALALGLTAGFACLVRAQTRYAFTAMLVVLGVMALPRWRLRLPAFAAMMGGVIALLGPVYLRTSWQLGELYTGTSYTSLLAVVDYSPIGMEKNPELPHEQGITNERDALHAIKAQASELLRENIAKPHWLLNTALKFNEFRSIQQMQAVAKMPTDMTPALLYAFIIPMTLGPAIALLVWGFRGLLPLAFLVGYFATHAAFSFYYPRFSAPVAFIGAMYLAPVLWLLLESDRAGRIVWKRIQYWRRALRLPFHRPGSKVPIPLRGLLIGATILGGWLIAATAFLIHEDTKPFHPVDAEQLLTRESTGKEFDRAGIVRDDSFRDEISKTLSSTTSSGTMRVGRLFLPVTIKPGEAPYNTYSERSYQPRSGGTYTLVRFLIPWKRGGFREYLLDVPGEAPKFREGQEAVVKFESDPEGERYTKPLRVMFVLPL